MKNGIFIVLLVMVLHPIIGSTQSRTDSLYQVWLDTDNHDTIRVKAFHTFSWEYLKTRPDTALELFKGVLAVSIPLGERYISDAFQGIGGAFFTMGQLDSAGFYWSKALSISERINYKEGLARGYNMVAVVYDRMGDFSKAEQLYLQSIELAYKLKDTTHIANAQVNLGALLGRSGRQDSAEVLLRKSYHLIKSTSDLSTTAKCANTLALNLVVTGHYQEAMDLYSEALKTFESLGDLGGQQQVINNIGNVCNDLNEYDKAIKYFTKCLEICKKMGDQYSSAGAEFNISTTHIHKREYQQAMIPLESAHKFFYENQLIEGLAATNNNFGILYKGLEEYKKAIEYFKKAEEFQTYIGPNENTAKVYSNLGYCFIQIGDCSQAIKYSQKSLKIAKESGSIVGAKGAFESLAQAYAACNQHEKAYEYILKYIVYHDSINMEENERAILRQEYAYEYEKAALADSLKQNEEKLQLELAHQEEITSKNQTRNMLVGAGMFVLLLAGGAWSRARFTKKANERLAIEKQRAQESERFKQIFLANMSHEIRTPMNAILGMTNLTLDTKVTKKQKEYLEAVKQSSESLLVIINDILDISKLEASGLVLETIPFKLKDVVQQVQTTLQFKAEEKGLDLKIELEDQLPEYVKGDPTRLGQILMNLTGNAIKFTDKGNITLSVSKQENRLRFSVKDTGVGIPKEQQEKLFDSFKQADASTTRKYGGTGLGLTIAKSFVELMGGKLSLESEKAKGSEFYFSLALQEASAEELASIESKQKTDFKKLKGIKILLAEDNKYNQIVVVDTLLNMVEDVKIETANNGLEALAKLQEQEYDLILMDSDMPEMDGRQATREIRKLKGPQKDIPIIALTASVLPTEINKCLEAGMNDSIPKPFQREEFFATIGKYYSRRT